MGKVVLSYNISKDLVSGSKEKLFKKIQGCEVTLEINDKVLDALYMSKDRELGATTILHKGQALCEKAVKELQSALDVVEKKLEAETDEAKRKQLRKDFRKDATDTLNKLKERLEKLPEEQWKKFLDKYGEEKKEYRKYKINAGVDITMGTLGVAGSAVAVAGTAHTGGASLALAIVGLTRSVATIAATAYHLVLDVDNYMKSLGDDILKMKEEFETDKKREKALAIGKDLMKAAVNTVIGAGFFTTVSTVGKKAEVLRGKVAAVFVASVKLSRKVSATRDKLLELYKESPSTLTITNVKKKLESLEKNFDVLFKAAIDLNMKARRLQKQLKAIEAALVILQNKTKTLAMFEKVIDLLTKVSLAGASAGVAIAAEGKETLEVANVVVNLGKDVVIAVKEAAI